MALTIKESLKTPTHTYSLMGADRPTHLHINNRVTDGNSVMVPRDEVIAACHITAADTPESVKRGIICEWLHTHADELEARGNELLPNVFRLLAETELREASDE